RFRARLRCPPGRGAGRVADRAVRLPTAARRARVRLAARPHVRLPVQPQAHPHARLAAKPHLRLRGSAPARLRHRTAGPGARFRCPPGCAPAARPAARFDCPHARRMPDWSPGRVSGWRPHPTPTPGIAPTHPIRRPPRRMSG
ncbi:hypothetical protein ACFY96_12110, partial [Streptomyces massasporeus]